MNLYSIFDKSSEEFSPPFASHNDRTATRSFLQMTKDHPFKSDLELYFICSWSSFTGMVSSEDKPILVSVDDIIYEIEHSNKREEALIV